MSSILIFKSQAKLSKTKLLVELSIALSVFIGAFSIFKFLEYYPKDQIVPTTGPSSLAFLLLLAGFLLYLRIESLFDKLNSPKYKLSVHSTKPVDLSFSLDKDVVDVVVDKKVDQEVLEALLFLNNKLWYLDTNANLSDLAERLNTRNTCIIPRL